MNNSQRTQEVWSYLKLDAVQQAGAQLDPAHVSAIIQQVLIQSGAGSRAANSTDIQKRIVQELKKASKSTSAGASAEVLGDKVAAGIVEGLGGLHTVVDRHFEGVAKDIANRHWAEVREERSARITRSVLDALGAERDTSLTRLLEGAAKAVTQGLSPNPTGSSPAPKGPPPGPIADPAGTIAMAVSQAVQQVAFNVQKIITVAIEDARSGDGENPKYPYP